MLFFIFNLLDLKNCTYLFHLKNFHSMFKQLWPERARVITLLFFFDHMNFITFGFLADK